MWVRLNCFLRRRHLYRLRLNKGRMYMECADCGHRSQGWEMGPKARPLTPKRPTRSDLRIWLDDTVATSAIEPSPESLRDPAPPRGELRLRLDS